MEYEIIELLFVNLLKIDCIQCFENTNIFITKNFMSFFLLSFEKKYILMRFCWVIILNIILYHMTICNIQYSNFVG